MTVSAATAFCVPSVFVQPMSPFIVRCLRPQLTQLRGSDKKFTLLNALVEQIMLHEPCLAAFTQELAEFETVPGGIR